MIINLNGLKSYQEILDKAICQKHNLNSKETINERILAFLVELGELANETRCFKYWSIREASETKIILEEYVDGIHFLTSLANELDMTLEIEITESTKSLTSQFIDVFAFAGILEANFNQENLSILINKYLVLGFSLGFNEADIIAGYLAKNKINHQRQEENY